MTRKFWIAFGLGVAIGFFGCGFGMLLWDRAIDDDRDAAMAEMMIDLGDVNFYDVKVEKGATNRMTLFDKPPDPAKGE